MNELIAALNQLEKEKGIDKDVIMEAIENSLLAACKRDFGSADNVVVNMDRETGDIYVYALKEVVEEVMDPALEISLGKAKAMNQKYELGDQVRVEITPKDLGRTAAMHARSVIVQKIKEEERRVVYDHFYCKEKDIVTGVVQRYVGENVSVSLDDRTDALLMKSEQIKGEVFRPTERIKLYIVEVKETNRGPRILVSRTHPDLVKRLFEKEVAEIQDGTVEIKNIVREAGSRTKMAVWSNDENVDPVGACVGLNGARVNAIVNDLKGEKIDIINWNEDPCIFIENASKVVSVTADVEEKSAEVVVPDYQLSLAIGKEGQNARLAARLTGYKIDIKSESQAQEEALKKEMEEETSDDLQDLNNELDLDFQETADEEDSFAEEETEVSSEEEEISDDMESEEPESEETEMSDEENEE